ncbi:oligosaccharide flippase family protein [Cognataquiflexum rubidum]|uniref:oligosaccharide flippase family protein n=1 Tax=Cognataquiflexum rubidum TaxID=2922273 RepID=UPI001F13B164|nr:oligosaccharide flippase family protein [Cognataquiflexum rubidum]MCH6233665.1 oligosaccharide flippase family protein [Cognataquiflexum rubidum]
MEKFARQSILTTLSHYLGVAIGYFNVLWLFPYSLAPEQIGVFRTVQDMAMLLVPFAQLGLGNAITRFFPQLKSKQGSFLTFSVLVTLMGFIAVSLLFFIFKSQIIAAFAVNSPQVIDFFVVVLLITLFAVVNTVLDAFSRSYMKIAIPTLLREVFLRLLSTVLVSVYLVGWIDFDQMIWGLSLNYLIVLGSLIIYMFRIGIFRVETDFFFERKGFKSEFLNYSFITLLGTAGGILIMKIDSLMVSSMIGLEANAIYNIAFSIAIVMEMPRRAISQVSMPVVADFFSKKEFPKIDKLYKDIAVNQTLICVLLFLGIWSNIDNLYHFVPNNTIYEAGKWVVLWIGFGKMCDIVFSINGEIIVFSKYYIFNITATVIMSVAVVVFNLLLIPSYGIEGAAFASFLAMFLYNFIKYLYIKIRLSFEPFSWDVLKIILLGVAIYFVQAYFFRDNLSGIADMVIRSGAITLLYGLGIVALGVAKENQKKVIQKIKGLRP